MPPVTGDPFSPRIDPLGERALLVRMDGQHRVLAIARALRADVGAGLVDAIPGDGSLLVVFDGTDAGEDRARAAIDLAVAAPLELVASRRHVVAVRYGGHDGPDLHEAARLTGLDPDELVARHAAAEHTVLFLGFAPGFPYLGGLPAELALPRLTAPRTVTPAGSVAIAEGYTGIYPTGLPGGWRVIGRTDIALFDPTADPPARLEPGDVVRFEAVR